MKRWRINTLWIVPLAWAAIAAEAALAEPEAEPTVAPDLTAVYETRLAARSGEARTQRWSFTRRGRQLEYRFLDTAIHERWQRDPKQNVSCMRIFERERSAVRYTAGDLLALNAAPDWMRLSHVITPPVGLGLTPGKKTSAFGREGQRFQGKHGALQLEVSWLDSLGIPSEVRATAPNKQRIHVRLVELTDSATAAVDLKGYRQVDVTDFGDMEQDPFVRRHARDLPPGPTTPTSLPAHAHAH